MLDEPAASEEYCPVRGGHGDHSLGAACGLLVSCDDLVGTRLPVVRLSECCSGTWRVCHTCFTAVRLFCREVTGSST